MPSFPQYCTVPYKQARYEIKLKESKKNSFSSKKKIFEQEGSNTMIRPFDGRVGGE
jgi:hypothetical protein